MALGGDRLAKVGQAPFLLIASSGGDFGDLHSFFGAGVSGGKRGRGDVGS